MGKQYQILTELTKLDTTNAFKMGQALFSGLQRYLKPEESRAIADGIIKRYHGKITPEALQELVGTMKRIVASGRIKDTKGFIQTLSNVSKEAGVKLNSELSKMAAGAGRAKNSLGKVAASTSSARGTTEDSKTVYNVVKAFRDKFSKPSSEIIEPQVRVANSAAGKIINPDGSLRIRKVVGDNVPTIYNDALGAKKQFQGLGDLTKRYNRLSTELGDSVSQAGQETIDRTRFLDQWGLQNFAAEKSAAEAKKQSFLGRLASLWNGVGQNKV